MRGVAGIELEILAVKATGAPYPVSGEDPRRVVFAELRNRGLLRIASVDEFGTHNEITNMGRIVLSASQEPQ